MTTGDQQPTAAAVRAASGIASTCIDWDNEDADGARHPYVMEHRVAAVIDSEIRPLVEALELANEYMEANLPANGWGLLDRETDRDRKDVLAKARAALAHAQTQP